MIHIRKLFAPGTSRALPLSLFIAACGAGATAPTSVASNAPPTVPTTTPAAPSAQLSINVTPNQLTDTVGQRTQFAVVMQDASGTQVFNCPVIWSTADTMAVQVASNGMAVAVRSGSGAVVATCAGVTAQATVNVVAAAAPIAPVTPPVTTPPVTTPPVTTPPVTTPPVTTPPVTTPPVTTPPVTTPPVTPPPVKTPPVTTPPVTTPPVTTPPVTTPVSTPTGQEPMYAASANTLLWQDNFDSRGTDAAMLASYALQNGESHIHFDATAGLNGSGAARIDWPAQTSSSCLDDSHLMERSFTPSQEVYVQYSVRYQAGFQYDWNNNRSSPLGCVGNAKKIMFLWAATGSRFDFISENHALGMGSDNDHPLFNQNAGPVMSDEMLGDGNWHRYTIHVRQSSTPTAKDGLIEGWIDGVQRWSWKNIASNASGGWVLFKMPTTFNAGSPVAQSEWMDGLTVWRP